MKNEEYIDINKIAELKGLKSNRSLRLAIQKGKYIARVVKVFGGKSYEILYSSLEPEIQEKLQDELIKEATQSNCTALVPINNINNKNFITESAKLTALARVDIVKALQNMRAKYKTKKEADSIFLDLYNSGIPCNLTFRRFAESFKKNNYSRWILFREGEKAYHDKVEAYIERDISKLEVGDVLIADGHTLNFQVINPFTGKPTRATLVGFLDWKSTALVGYEIMMSENTQCIASALRNAIINLGMIPKVIYQDNGKAFKAKYFHDKQGEKNLSRSLTGARCDFLAQALKNQHACQNIDFDEVGAYL